MGSIQAIEGINYAFLLKNMHFEIQLSLSSTQRSTLNNDWKKLFNRFSNEGIGFLTTTLPNLGKEIISSFKTGSLKVPTSFKKMKGTNLPLFYNRLFCRIYDSNGVLKLCPDTESIRVLNQLLFMFYKLEVPYTDKKKDKVLKDYIETENDLKTIFLREDDEHLAKARKIITNMFKDFDPMDIVPHISNGALATGEKGADKYYFKRKYSKIHEFYPYYRYFVASPDHLFGKTKDRNFVNYDPSLIKWYKGLENCVSGVSKMCFVNKDSRGPRTISMEPCEYQYIQQGLKDRFVEHLERFTQNEINFLDQGHNQKAAYDGSITGNYQTIDFSSASDRVSLELVNNLFRDVPRTLDALHAVRSTHTMLPNGDIIKLNKYAPMGSSMCFPVLATVIYALSKAFNEHLRILVYGDDLILEDDSCYAKLDQVFSRYKLKINENKSFSSGMFRESCGCDAFAGTIITPIRIKKEVDTCLPESLAALVSSSNEFYRAGYWHLAGCLRTIIQRSVSMAIPTSHVCENVDGLSFCFATDAISNVISIVKDGIVRYKKLTLSLIVPKKDTTINDDYSYLIGLTRPSVDDSPPSCIVIRNKDRKPKLKFKYKSLMSSWISKRIFA
jgi:hypothetical protein